MARTKRKTNPVIPAMEAPAQAQKQYRTAAYVRLSVEDSGKPGADTIEGQKNLLLHFIENEKSLSLYGLFCDNGRTGTDFERPEFEKLMEAVKHGEVDCIVVKDLSRFGRNYKETGNYLERIFPFLGVRFIAVNDGFDTLTAERGADGYLVPLKNLINEVYSKDISKKSGSALATKQKNGDFIGAWAPYGYRKCADDPHKLEPDEATAPIVRQIFQWRVDGMSVTRIAKKLNDSGIPSPSAYLYNTGVCKTEKYNGAIWHIQAVKIILTRQVYIGHMVQGTKRQSFYEKRRQYKKPQEEWVIVENTHEPIIDRDTFEKVQEIMRQRNEEYFEKLGRFSYLETTENILKGLIYCADCKRPLVRYKNVSHNKKLWYTFICQTHSNDITSCPKKNIREDALIPMLMQAIQTQIELAADMDELVRRVNSSPKHRKRTADLQGRLDSAKKALKRYNNLYDSLYQNYVDKLMTEQEYITLKSRYRAEAEEAERLIEALTRQQAEESEHTPENRFLTAFGSFKGENTLTKEMAQALIDRVYVDGNSNIETVFRYRDEYRALCTYLEGKENGA
ncbi:recombinase family protein [Allofournierella sp.]|uniref:recombinase family protein n=1 Tax=Allofournierella sp. TaxID=1940256 RepID=UPI003AF03BC6